MQHQSYLKRLYQQKQYCLAQTEGLLSEHTALTEQLLQDHASLPYFSSYLITIQQEQLLSEAFQDDGIVILLPDNIELTQRFLHQQTPPLTKREQIIYANACYYLVGTYDRTYNQLQQTPRK